LGLPSAAGRWREDPASDLYTDHDHLACLGQYEQVVDSSSVSQAPGVDMDWVNDESTLKRRLVAERRYPYLSTSASTTAITKML
jgi:hypothetical protein